MTVYPPQLAMALRAKHLSLTTARRHVYEQLAKSEPLNMGELIRACLHINPASVYRTVSLYEQLGIVQRLQIGWKYKLELSNAYQEHHHHLTCTKCGKTIPLPEDEQIEQRLQELATQLQFKPQDHQLELRGVCRDCQPKNPGRNPGFV